MMIGTLRKSADFGEMTLRFAVYNGMPAVVVAFDGAVDADAAAQADALKNQHPDWAAGNNIPRPNEPGAIFADRVAYENWQRQYDAARDGAKYLDDLKADLSRGLDTYQ